jgi:hypothetical protein
MKKQFGPRYLLAVTVILAIALAGGCDSDAAGALGGSYGDESRSKESYDSVVTEKGHTSPAAIEKRASPEQTESSRGEQDDGGSVVVTAKRDIVQATNKSSSGSASIENEIASATDGRVIIRTADLSVTVDDVTQVMDDISNITNAAGGWVVTSEQPQNYSGNISIRVPADRFDDVIDQLTELAVKVKAVSTRSEDFTGEFTDVTARSQTLDDTLERLRILYDRAFTVEDAITIQKEITDVQSDLESLEARLKFLSQSSAFSFISISLESVPVELFIDAGGDITAAVGHPVTYRAKFNPPEGMEDFFITWNFGDGTREETTDRIAPTGNGDEVISSPVIHYFNRDEDSPFIVTVELNGSGDAGIADGEDTLVTTVSRLPVIEVFAGENQTVESGSKIDLAASFTRPDGVSGISYSWNFGDGSAPIEGHIGLSEGGGQVNTTHAYQNFRPNPYVVILTVTGQTEVGEVQATGELLVFVRETIGVSVAELDVGNTIRDAVRTLHLVGVFLAKIGLWLVILSPAWLIGVSVIFLLIRRRNATGIRRRNMK